MRETLKAVARAVATIGVSPLLLSYAVRRVLLGGDRALEGSAQTLSQVSGIVGEYLRRAFLARVLAGCAPTATIQFGALFSQVGSRIDDRVYIGPRCHLGLVHLEKDVLLAAGVHVPSGGATHGIADPDTPIRDQPGARTLVTIGEGTWIGSAAIVMADVGKHCVIGAGSVVTRPIPDYSIAAGVPATIIRTRKGSGLGARGSGAETDGSGLGARGSATETDGSGLEARGSATETDGSGLEARGSATETDGSGLGARGSGAETDGSGLEARGSGTETDGSGLGARGSGVGAITS
ncbi:MAG: DapH/DapD/GlmU-related protein [Vicinamibacterales bacterium]